VGESGNFNEIPAILLVLGKNWPFAPRMSGKHSIFDAAVACILSGIVLENGRDVFGFEEITTAKHRNRFKRQNRHVFQ